MPLGLDWCYLVQPDHSRNHLISSGWQCCSANLVGSEWWSAGCRCLEWAKLLIWEPSMSKSSASNDAISRRFKSSRSSSISSGKTGLNWLGIGSFDDLQLKLLWSITTNPIELSVTQPYLLQFLHSPTKYLTKFTSQNLVNFLLSQLYGYMKRPTGSWPRGPWFSTWSHQIFWDCLLLKYFICREK